MTADPVAALARRLRSTQRLLVLTGAGVSKESGIPTFRGSDGLWRRHRAEELATPAAFARDPKLVWEWYRWRQGIIRQCRPNPGHDAIARLEALIPDFLLVTQNVDNLHRQAGSRRLVELHGNIFRSKCSRCDYSSVEPVAQDPPRCACGALLRPDVVWFGERLKAADIERAFGFARNSETVLVVGTSGLVQPAASIPSVAKAHGAWIAEINPCPTPISDIADVALTEPAGVVLPRIAALLVS